MAKIIKILLVRQLILIILLFGYCSNAAWAEENQAQPTDLIELAAIMLRDGHNDRALLALQSVDLE
ncbi:MAG: hypothetical protein OEW97_06635, partial [Gammaproteobacteria bacterium]|nr:hypothetical protein [Gammaproteobacteria bacterium]